MIGSSVKKANTQLRVYMALRPDRSAYWTLRGEWCNESGYTYYFTVSDAIHRSVEERDAFTHLKVIQWKTA